MFGESEGAGEPVKNFFLLPQKFSCLRLSAAKNEKFTAQKQIFVRCQAKTLFSAYQCFRIDQLNFIENMRRTEMEMETRS